MTLTIVQALPEVAPVLSEVAIAAKSYWGYPAHWIDQWRAQLTIKPDYVLDNLWVRPDQIGTGVGRMLFEHAVVHAAARGADTLELEVDPHAAGFYQRMGMQHVGAIAVPMDGLERYLPVFRLRIEHSSIASKG